MITERDKQTLRWMNGFGAVVAQQVANHWGVDLSTASRRIRNWVDDGIAIKKTVPGVWYRPLVLTAAGCRIAGDDLPPLKGIRRGTLYHDLRNVDLAAALTKRFGGTFDPPRRIHHRHSVEHKQSEHCPDGFLHLPGRSPVAVELELSPKSPERLKQIFEYYAAQLDISLVLYLTDTAAIARLLRRVLSEVFIATPVQIEFWGTSDREQI